MTQTADQLSSIRQDLHRLAARLTYASELFRRGLGGEAAPQLENAARLVDDLGVNLDDMLSAMAVDAAVDAAVNDFAAGAEQVADAVAPAPAPRQRRPRPKLVEAPPAAAPEPDSEPEPEPEPAQPQSIWGDDEDDDDDEGSAPAPLEIVDNDTTTTGVDEPPASVPGSPDEKIGEFEIRKIRGRRFVRCPEFVCSARIWLEDDEDTVADIERAVLGHSLGGDCLAKKAARSAKSRG